MRGRGGTLRRQVGAVAARVSCRHGVLSARRRVGPGMSARRTGPRVAGPAGWIRSLRAGQAVAGTVSCSVRKVRVRFQASWAWVSS
ncbi:hypothetical protein SRO_0438 [Streptomyces rochei]|nr:hypothetical protein SRO_0438 [Streptomyces rochei]